MTHYHNNYALVQCIDPTTYKVRQEDPQQLEVDGEWIDLLPFWRWEMVGVGDALGEAECAQIVDDGNYMYPVFDPAANYGIIAYGIARDSFASLLRSLNLDPARCLVFKQMEK